MVLFREIRFHQKCLRCKFSKNRSLCTFSEVCYHAFLLSGGEPNFSRDCTSWHKVKVKSNFGESELMWNWCKIKRLSNVLIKPGFGGGCVGSGDDESPSLLGIATAKMTTRRRAEKITAPEIIFVLLKQQVESMNTLIVDIYPPHASPKVLA